MVTGDQQPQHEADAAGGDGGDDRHAPTEMAGEPGGNG
jgi:hypothetical protein